jgi:hypothetical protein
MKTHGLRITAFDDSFWTAWPSAAYDNTGFALRRLHSGQKQGLRLRPGKNTDLLGVVSLTAPPTRNPAKVWRVLLDGTAVAVHHRKTFPKHLLLELPAFSSPNGADLVFEPISAANPSHDLLIEEINVMPRTGRFSLLWTSPWRALKKLASKRSLSWAPADFPYSHFDGLGYLLDHDEVRQAVLSHKYDTAFHYWFKKGRHQGHPLALAVEREPLPGTPFNLVMHYKGEHETRFRDAALWPQNCSQKLGGLNTLHEENELLLLQLHQVQEELEEYILKDNNISNITKECDKLRKTVTDQAECISKLKVELTSYEKRQQHIGEDYAQLESQVTLLKTLLADSSRP